MVKAVIFDLDGTLLNTLPDIRDSMNRSLRALGLPEHETARYRTFVGNGVRMLAERAVGTEHIALREKAAELYTRDYQANSAHLTKPYDGITDMLRDIQASHTPMAVLSNKPHPDTLRVVAHYFPNIHFTVIRGHMPDMPMKPDPAPALAVAVDLKVLPAECLYAGDTSVDMICANAAGMMAVGVLWGFRECDELLESGAQAIIRCPRDITDIVMKNI
jgi:phosphoglycolate phosphatase